MKNEIQKIGKLEDKRVSHLKGNKVIREWGNKLISKAILVKYYLNCFIKELIPLFTYSPIHFKKAFTLAEVLITLGIIGVVAAMTMPTLIANYQEKVTVTGLKHAYSVISQAFTNIIANEGTPDTWNLSSADEFRDLFAKYIRNAKKCNAGADEDCQPLTKSIRSTTQGNNLYNVDEFHSNLVLNNGSTMTFWLNDEYYIRNCDENPNGIPNACMLTIHVDINGHKKPNTWGKDRFQFFVYKYKILPAGHPDMTSGDTFADTCIDKSGMGCAAWVLYNENTDYLKCPEELSWSGKTKCN